MLRLDTPERFRAVYGFSKEDLNPERIRKYDQVVNQGVNVWRKRGRAGENATGYEFMPCSIGGVVLWNPIMRCSSRKTVIDTPLVERRGAVKEIVSTDDYVITIRGTIKRPDGYWPADEIEALNEMYLRNEALPILSPRTAILLNGNEYVVITNIDFPEKPGFTESVDWMIECTSDIPFSLELDENGNEL